jgi:hypothetical protein
VCRGGHDLEFEGLRRGPEDSALIVRVAHIDPLGSGSREEGREGRAGIGLGLAASAKTQQANEQQPSHALHLDLLRAKVITIGVMRIP